MKRISTVLDDATLLMADEVKKQFYNVSWAEFFRRVIERGLEEYLKDRDRKDV